MEMMTTSTRRTGIIHLDTFSIPSCTPLYTINAVTPMKISAKITGEVEDVIKEVK